MRSSWFLLMLLVMGAGCGRGPTAQPAQAGTPWTWKSDLHGFEVTIPSEQWKTTPNANVLAKFDCLRPLLVATVIGVSPAKTDAEFEAAVTVGGQAKESGSSNVHEQSGPNRHGREHWIYIADLMGAPQPRVFGASVTRVDGKAVLMMFEGPCRQGTEAERLQEARALRAQAELFLGSVR